MMTEMDDPMVLESLLPYPKDLDRSVLAARAREMQEDVLLYKEVALQPTGRCVQVRTPSKMMTEMDDPMVLESVLAARARKMQEDVLLYKEVSLQPTGRCVQVRTPSKMMTEMDDPMVLESVLAARARAKQEAMSRNGVFENSVVDSPASGAMEVTKQVVGLKTSPSALTHNPVGDHMSKHGDGTQTESAQEERLALSTKPSEGGIASELPFESSSFLSLDSRNLNANAGEGTVVAPKTCRIRRKNWGQKETDGLLQAVLNTKKGNDSDSSWDAVAKAVPGRAGHECRGRMDTLKRSFSTIKKYCDGQLKEFKQLNEKDFGKMKVSPRLTEAWYNQIRDYCPPRPKKKFKTNGAGSSSKSTGLVPDTSISGLWPPVVPDGIDQGEPTMVERRLVQTMARGTAAAAVLVVAIARGDNMWVTLSRCHCRTHHAASWGFRWRTLVQHPNLVKNLIHGSTPTNL